MKLHPKKGQSQPSENLVAYSILDPILVYLEVYCNNRVTYLFKDTFGLFIINFATPLLGPSLVANCASEIFLRNCSQWLNIIGLCLNVVMNPLVYVGLGIDWNRLGLPVWYICWLTVSAVVFSTPLGPAFPKVNGRCYYVKNWIIPIVVW